MQRSEAQTVILYFYDIPEQAEILKRERREIEAEYFGLRGVAMDGMPHGSNPGKPVEGVAIALEESGDGERIREIEKQMQILLSDRQKIQGVVDGLNSRYKTILSMKYSRGYSWGAISARMGVPDSTARHWNEKALEKLSKELPRLPKWKDILCRASRARV